MKRILFLAVSVFLIGCTIVVAEDTRDWKLADKSTITGSLESVEIVIRLPNGITKNVPISELAPEEQRALEKWIANQAKQAAKAKPNAAAAQGAIAGRKPPAAAPPKRGAAQKAANQRFITFGDVKLSDAAIAAFIENCKSQKPQALEKLRERINDESKKASQRELAAMKDLFQFVSQPNVLIAIRSEFCGGGTSQIGKYEINESAFTAYGVIDTLKILDKRTVLVEFKCTKAVIEGVDTSQIPLGKWNSTYLLRYAGIRKVPAAIGEEQIPVYEAISGEGFPKDIVFW